MGPVLYFRIPPKHNAVVPKDMGKIKDYPTTLLLATHDLRLWLLGDAEHEQQFLGCRVSRFFCQNQELLVHFNGQQRFQNPRIGNTGFDSLAAE